MKLPGAKGAVMLMLFLVLAFATLGCITQNGQNNQTAAAQTPVQTTVITLRISGSTTAEPLVAAIAEQFNKDQKNISVSVGGGGSGVGISDLHNGLSAIGMISRNLTKDDLKFQTPTQKFEATAIAFDSIAIVVSSEVFNHGVKALNASQLKKIYAGNVTNWKELGGDDRRIYAIGREEGSGTRDTFNQFIMGNTSVQTPGVSTVASSNSEVKTAIVGSDKAVGYLSIGYVNNTGIAVPLAIAVPLNGIVANITTTKDGTYPLSRKLFLVTLGKRSPAVQQFIDYAADPTKGQKIASENGYVAL